MVLPAQHSDCLEAELPPDLIKGYMIQTFKCKILQLNTKRWKIPALNKLDLCKLLWEAYGNIQEKMYIKVAKIYT